MRAERVIVLLLTACFVATLLGAGSARAMELMTEDTGGFFAPPSPMQSAAYEQTRDLGARFVRGLVRRDTLMADPNVPATWQGVDAFVDTTRAQGFEPYLTLTYRPRDWSDPATALPIPSEAEFGAWCGAAAARYRGRVAHYSVWNEPNGLKTANPAYDPVANPSAPPAIPLDAATYGRLYRACWDAIKREDPAAHVYFGELATYGGACAYALGALDAARVTYADGLAIHPYQFDLAPEAAYSDAACKGIGRLADWRATVAGAAAAGRLLTPDGRPLPLLITEFGYCTADGECPERAAAANRLPEPARADWLARAYGVAAREGVTLFSYYHLLKQADSAIATKWDTGIVELDGTATPSVGSLQAAAFAQRLSGLLDLVGVDPAPFPRVS